MNKLAVSFWKNIVPERHICISCGYMEQYVADPADRAAIGSNWPGRGGGSTASGAAMLRPIVGAVGTVCRITESATLPNKAVMLSVHAAHNQH